MIDRGALLWSYCPLCGVEVPRPGRHKKDCPAGDEGSKPTQPDHNATTFIWVHDCPSCTFLGTFNDHDLYHCTQHGSMPTVIARFGNEGPDYISGTALAETFKPTAAAIVMDKPIGLPREAKSALALRVALLLALDVGLFE